MNPLLFPEVDDEGLIQALPKRGVNNLTIAAFKSDVLKAYARYRKVVRRPLANLPVIDDVLKAALIGKYGEGRSGQGPFQFIARRATPAGTVSCPYCGRFALGTVDHYLPKEHFAWYAVYSYNLTPSCHQCQGTKGSRTKLSRAGRPIHPILDRIALAQKFCVHTLFNGSGVSDADFEFRLAPVLKRAARQRKKEERLFRAHWKFFQIQERHDVISSCRLILADIRISLARAAKLDPSLSTNVASAEAWVREELRVAQSSEDLTTKSYLHLAMLRGFTKDTGSLRALTTIAVPEKERTAQAVTKLLRKRV